MIRNGTQIFRNDELDVQVRIILNSDGGILVSAEDTAIGFGWSRQKNGKQYIMWDRFNGFCEMLGFPHKCGKDDYIPESLYYLLGMKANNERAQKYQCWLAMEVLPSIRKTGSYSLGQKQEPPYEYFDKEFNGVPVVSTLDIAHFTGLSQANVKYYLNKCDLICGIDYFVAEGRALAKMKKRYPKLSVMISKMLLFTKSGFDKLMKECGANVNSLKCFENIKCSEPVNDMHILIDTVLVELNQLHDTVKKLDRYNTAAEQKLYKDRIKNLEKSVSQKLVVMSQVDMQNITGNFSVAAIDKKEILESKQYSFLEEPLAVFYNEKGNTTAVMLK